jgi:hypothetical protein
MQKTITTYIKNKSSLILNIYLKNYSTPSVSKYLSFSLSKKQL